MLQHDCFNLTRLNTAIVVAITSNLKYGGLPGNVRLPKREGRLPRPSVINVTQIATVERADIDSVAGRLSRRRLAEMWDGVRLVIQPN